MKIDRLKIVALMFIFFSLSFYSCEKDNPNVNDEYEFTNEEVSEWIYQVMNTIYLWKDNMPGNLNPGNEPDPIDFYNKLLYTEEDKWSFITDDYESFRAELAGTPLSTGYSPTFGRFRDSERVLIIVEYVIPGTPASEAGLERGDIITSIDGTELNTSNYLDLYRQESYTAGLSEYDGNTLVPTNESISLTAEVITSRPVIHQEVIEYQNKKIGYIVYVDFKSGSGDIFIDQLDDAFTGFQNEGIDELIVDLRYNPGGEIRMAKYLASSIAPASVASPSNVLVSYVFNNELNKMFLDDGGENSPDLNLFFTANTAVNLNLNRVYFMTGSGTASASELVITGLDPYMEVVTVGDTTYGKYTGAWVFPDNETPPRHNYAIIPIVLKYANSEGVTEFKDGLVPTYPISDQLLDAKPFGSFSDPVLARTLEAITGINPMPSAKKYFREPDYSIIFDEKEIFRKNLQTGKLNLIK